MKSTFYFIDKLMKLLAIISKEVATLSTEKDKTEARWIVDEIDKIAITLEALIKSHNEEEHLKVLHDTHIAEVENWADHVSALFVKLNKLMEVLHTDAVILRNVLDNSPEQWASKVSDMAFGMVMTGLHDDEEQLKRFKEIEVFEVARLKAIIKSEEHVAELLK